MLKFFCFCTSGDFEMICLFSLSDQVISLQADFLLLFAPQADHRGRRHELSLLIVQGGDLLVC